MYILCFWDPDYKSFKSLLYYYEEGIQLTHSVACHNFSELSSFIFWVKYYYHSCYFFCILKMLPFHKTYWNAYYFSGIRLKCNFKPETVIHLSRVIRSFYLFFPFIFFNFILFNFTILHWLGPFKWALNVFNLPDHSNVS